MILLTLFVTIVKCSPISKTSLQPYILYYDSRHGLILQRIQSVDQVHRFEYRFNLTIGQAHGDKKTKCGKLTEESITNDAWGKTMLNLRFVFIRHLQIK